MDRRPANACAGISRRRQMERALRGAEAVDVTPTPAGRNRPSKATNAHAERRHPVWAGHAARVFCFVRQTCWSSAFRLFRAANMLKHELQQLTFVKQKTRVTPRITRGLKSRAVWFSLTPLEAPTRLPA